jgi:hypothetical protein
MVRDDTDSTWKQPRVMKKPDRGGVMSIVSCEPPSQSMITMPTAIIMGTGNTMRR